MTRIRVKRDDYSRVLITETQPYELPIHISNEGFYEVITRLQASEDFDSLLKTFINKIIGLSERVSFKEEMKSATCPYSYKVTKGVDDFRRLSLMHHRSQWRIKLFYESYSDLIIDYCSKSRATIRSPDRISGSFFSKKGAEAFFYYFQDSDKKNSTDDEEAAARCSSFFSYRGVDRLYKFFLSKEYITLEKKYRVLRTLDVSKCFDSIYTHTVTWAVKDKKLSKSYPKAYTFGTSFDNVMQGLNNQETNGIIIGPEVSRVFAEIILQKVDVCSISKLEKPTKAFKEGLVFNRDYAIRRYVDDVFIFANSEDVAQYVCEVISEELLKFNLHINKHKSLSYTRPFATEKSKIIDSAKSIANDFIGKITEERGTRFYPVRIYSPWGMSREFIEKIKTLCSDYGVSYSEVSGFLISFITERVKKAVIVPGSQVVGKEAEYRDFLCVLMEILYFLYQVAPSVSASYKLCTAIILALRFSKNNLLDEVEFVYQKIYEFQNEVLENLTNDRSRGIENFLHLEVVNLIMVCKELGSLYHMDVSVVRTAFNFGDSMSYFDIVSFLFYAGDKPEYDHLQLEVIDYIDNYLSSDINLFTNSEAAHLVLDLFCCPYISLQLRAKWLRRCCSLVEMGAPTKAVCEKAINFIDLHEIYFHSNWSNIDLLSSLEKKELKKVY